MAAESAPEFLSEIALEGIKRIEKADILVGIPSCNDAGTIADVVRTVATGLSTYFPGARSVLVNADGGSKDGTPQLFEEAVLSLAHRPPPGAPPVSPVETIRTSYGGFPGRGSAFQQIFGIADRLGVTACAVFDPEVKSVAPDWVEKLIRPVLEGSCDYVAPLFRRHKYDGTITNSIVYPLLRGLYARGVRQPVGGEFGLAGKLVGHCLSREAWGGEAERWIDIWITTIAVAEGYRVCQTYLGRRVVEPKEPPPELSTLLMQVVGSVFRLLEEYEAVWRQTGKGEPVSTPVDGNSFSVEPIQVNVERMVRSLRQGLRDLLPVWEIILPPETLSELLPLGLRDLEEFHFPDDLWVQVIYDFALAYHEQVLHREHLLKSLTPLYLGRTASFILETRSGTSGEVEGIIERLCTRYGVLKPYLVERWR